MYLSSSFVSNLNLILNKPFFIKKTQLRRTCNFIMYNPIIGSELAIPLNILQLIFTTTYYNNIIINPQLILLQLAIAIFTYGGDRLFDAVEYNNTLSISNNTEIYSLEKINYYNDIILNIGDKYMQICLSYSYIFYIMIQNIELFPIFMLLSSTIYYRDLKKQFGQFKAIYIGVFWSIGTIILPCVIIDHNYEILNHPSIYLPDILLMFGLSNVLDIKDSKEDYEKGISTLPVIFGDNKAIIISNIAYLLSFLIFVSNFYNI